MQCAFCEIPEIKDRQVMANELAWAFPTNIPIVPGHILYRPGSREASLEEELVEVSRLISDAL